MPNIGPTEEPLSVREVLDFMSRHLTNRHVKSLSEVAGLNSANVYASLAGRRPLPIDTVRRLADATGLRVHEGVGALPQLSVKPDKVLNFDVALEDLPKFTDVIRALGNAHTNDPARSWWLVSALSATNVVGAVETPGVYAIAIRILHHSYTVPNSYAVVNIAWPSLSAARNVEQNPALLLDHLLEPQPRLDPYVIKADNSRWIQLRSGFASARELDDYLGVSRTEPEPTGADWGRLLKLVSEKGLSPGDVIGSLDLVREKFSR